MLVNNNKKQKANKKKKNEKTIWILHTMWWEDDS